MQRVKCKKSVRKEVGSKVYNYGVNHILKTFKDLRTKHSQKSISFID